MFAALRFLNLPKRCTPRTRSLPFLLCQKDVVYLNEPLSFTWATGLGDRVRLGVRGFNGVLEPSSIATSNSNSTPMFRVLRGTMSRAPLDTRE